MHFCHYDPSIDIVILLDFWVHESQSCELVIFQGNGPYTPFSELNRVVSLFSEELYWDIISSLGAGLYQLKIDGVDLAAFSRVY